MTSPFKFNLINRFVYSGTLVEPSTEYTTVSAGIIDPAIMSNAVSNVGIISFMISLLYAVCFCILVYVNLIFLFWWLEHRNVLGFYKFSIFKMLTFGKSSADQVDAKHMALVFLIVNFVFCVIVLGYAKELVKFLVIRAIKIINYIGGGT